MTIKSWPAVQPAIASGSTSARSGETPGPTVKSGWEKAFSSVPRMWTVVAAPQNPARGPSVPGFLAPGSQSEALGEDRGVGCVGRAGKISCRCPISVAHDPPAWAAMLVSLLRRIVILTLTVVAVTTAVFVLIHVSGDPTDGFLAPGSSPEVRDAVRQRLGLDKPLAEQYVQFVGRTFVGDFGESWRNRQPALDAVVDRLPATLRLSGAAIVISVVVGLTLGVLSAWLRSGLL